MFVVGVDDGLCEGVLGYACIVDDEESEDVWFVVVDCDAECLIEKCLVDDAYVKDLVEIGELDCVVSDEFFESVLE